jgi:hypothetical protein
MAFPVFLTYFTEFEIWDYHGCCRICIDNPWVKLANAKKHRDTQKHKNAVKNIKRHKEKRILQEVPLQVRCLPPLQAHNQAPSDAEPNKGINLHDSSWIFEGVKQGPFDLF